MQGQETSHLLVEDPFYNSDGSFSPDGRWIVYTSTEQGSQQVFVISFPGLGVKRQISSEGGSTPVWRKDGEAVIYVDDSGNLLETTVSVRNSELSVRTTRILFPANPQTPIQAARSFEIAPDGRFLINTRSQENQTQIVLVSNWDASLNK